MANRPGLRIAVLGLRGIPNVQGGIETHCQALYPRLASKGHKITLFARKGYVPNAPYQHKGVKVVPLWTFRNKSLEAMLHTLNGIFRLALQRDSFDFLHIHGIGPSLVIPFARLLRIPVVMTHHGPDYDRQKWGSFAKKVLRLGERNAARYATEIITVSQHIRNVLKKAFGCEATYIPNGVDLPEIIRPGEFLNRYGLESKKYILAVGRLVPEKGFHDLLKAFRKIDSGWNLVIAGDADHEDEYSRGLKEQAKADKRVVMAGFIKGADLQEVFSNAGLFVLPSYHEGLPIVVLEAMSYGLPVLSSDIPANRELVSVEDTFPVGDVKALFGKLRDKIMQARPSLNGRERIEKEFNWDLIAEQTESVYFSLFEHGASGSRV